MQKYGSNVKFIFDIYRDYYDEAMKEGINPIVLATLIYAMEYELAYTPLDYFIRRTSEMFFAIEKVTGEKEAVIQYMAKALGWSKEEKTRYAEELELAYEEAKLKNMKEEGI